MGINVLQSFLNQFFNLQAIQEQDAKSLPNINDSSFNSPLPISTHRDAKSTISVFGGKNKNDSQSNHSTSNNNQIMQSVILQPKEFLDCRRRIGQSLNDSPSSLENSLENHGVTQVSSLAHSAFKPHKSFPNLNNTSLHQSLEPTSIQSTLNGSNGLQLKTLKLQTPNKGQSNKSSSNGKFSHQNRRRPVYQRSNTEPESLEEATFPSMNQSFSSVSSIRNQTNFTPLGCDSSKMNNNSLCQNEQVCKTFEASTPTKHPPGSTSNVIPAGCVYLRPEQNIPDVFFASRKATTFKPIVDRSGIEVTRDVNVLNHGRCSSDQDSKMFDEEIKTSNDMQSRCDQDISISRDDIVVTMRSVNV